MLKIAKSGLAVAECRYYDEGNNSIKTMIEMVVSEIEGGHPFDFRYDMFVDGSSLKLLIDAYKRLKFETVYIGGHGSAKGIDGLGQVAVGLDEIAQFVSKGRGKQHITGVYLAACGALSPQSAHQFGKALNSRQDVWIAGYEKKVNWIPSTTVDMVFWYEFLNNKLTARNRRKEIDIACDAAREVDRWLPLARQELGFNLYAHRDGVGHVSIWDDPQP